MRLGLGRGGSMTRPQLGGLSSELKTAARYVDRALPKDQSGILSFGYFHSPVVGRFAKEKKDF